jgi:dihydrofolate reductase
MRLTVTTFVSLDGVMQGPGGPDEDRSGGFDRGGWLVPFADDDMGAAVDRWFSEADAFLLGRRTYEIFAGYWPLVTDPEHPVASRLNGLPKYVATRTLRTAEWAGTTLLEGDVVEEVRRLKDQPGRELQVHGSGDLLQTLTAHDLVDEHRLFVYPVVVGAGRRLFRDGAPPRTLELTEHQMTTAGVAILTYAPAGPLQPGSFSPPPR